MLKFFVIYNIDIEPTAVWNVVVERLEWRQRTSLFSRKYLLTYLVCIGMYAGIVNTC